MQAQSAQGHQPRRAENGFWPEAPCLAKGIRVPDEAHGPGAGGPEQGQEGCQQDEEEAQSQHRDQGERRQPEAQTVRRQRTEPIYGQHRRTDAQGREQQGQQQALSPEDAADLPPGGAHGSQHGDLLPLAAELAAQGSGDAQHGKEQQAPAQQQSQDAKAVIVGQVFQGPHILHVLGRSEIEPAPEADPEDREAPRGGSHLVQPRALCKAQKQDPHGAARGKGRLRRAHKELGQADVLPPWEVGAQFFVAELALAQHHAHQGIGPGLLRSFDGLDLQAHAVARLGLGKELVQKLHLHGKLSRGLRHPAGPELSVGQSRAARVVIPHGAVAAAAKIVQRSGFGGEALPQKLFPGLRPGVIDEGVLPSVFPLQFGLAAVIDGQQGQYHRAGQKDRR